MSRWVQVLVVLGAVCATGGVVLIASTGLAPRPGVVDGDEIGSALVGLSVLVLASAALLRAPR